MPEIYVCNLVKSVEFYIELDFRLIRSEPQFAVMIWEDSVPMLEEIEGQQQRSDLIVVNIRIMVSDVDMRWQKINKMSVRVLCPLADRHYGLPDCTVVSPDGTGLRFATRIE